VYGYTGSGKRFNWRGGLMDEERTSVLSADDVALVKVFTAQFAAIGEPWLLRFVPEELATKLSAMGFLKVFHLT